ncbi:ABC transporter permease [Streptomyces sp. CB03234]|uniref:ABC transporter permease n=1 Tax=Streptomyces sp. (strain CB03234) TaxID=1703937 RepID=UPI00093B4E02|nr:ABC transporter permease [Streptomyces sp. CB03234]OKK04802.1 ABC transporter permease [Streptomyces sp. CB03234]
MSITADQAAEKPGAVAATVPPHPQRYRGSGFGRQVAVLSGRSLRALRDPALVLPGVLEPILMLTVFSQVFRSVAETSTFPEGVSYIDFLLPAFLVTSAVSAGLKSGVALTTELGNGIIARFRSMPIHTASILIGRSVADTALSAVNMVVLLAAGALIFGYEPGGGFLGAVGCLLVAVLLSWSLGWIFMAMSAWLRRPEALQPVGGIVNLVLLFASNAFVPADGLPGWLRAFASVNPMSHAITAARDLSMGRADAATVLAPLGICAVLVALTAPLAVHSFRRAS